MENLVQYRRTNNTSLLREDQGNGKYKYM